jgi:hypothetical protein
VGLRAEMPSMTARRNRVALQEFAVFQNSKITLFTMKGFA